jgi:endonuclease-3 related protein
MFRPMRSAHSIARPTRRAARPRDLPGDPGLERTPRRSARGPYVGTHGGRALRRFALDPGLDRLLLDLQRGFGPQCWWPAETPFEVLIGAILTQNTAWTNVEKALRGLRATGELTPARLLALGPEELERAIRSSGFFRAKAKKLRELSRWYLEIGGLRALREEPLPSIRPALLDVFGVGPETADSILCYGAGRRTAVVDVYTRRILGRHGLAAADAPYEELRTWLEERLVPSQPVFEEFHALFVRAGHHHCRPTARCEGCPTLAPRGVERVRKVGPGGGRS